MCPTRTPKFDWLTAAQLSRSKTVTLPILRLLLEFFWSFPGVFLLLLFPGPIPLLLLPGQGLDLLQREPREQWVYREVRRPATGDRLERQ